MIAHSRSPRQNARVAELERYLFDGGRGHPLTEPGDSGGPLYAERADGSRDPVGVVSGYAASYGYGFAKLSRADVTAFIRANAIDTSPTALWFRRHGKVSGDHWYGETDYVGPCLEARDSDCDRWFNEHDNCPTIHNPFQADSDEDGVGDACDWCAGAHNPPQQNCNERAENAESVRRLVVIRKLGDVCDPIPCARSAPEPTAKLDEVCVPAGAPYQGQECTATPVSDSARVTALGSYPMTGVGSSRRANTGRVRSHGTAPVSRPASRIRCEPISCASSTCPTC